MRIFNANRRRKLEKEKENRPVGNSLILDGQLKNFGDLEKTFFGEHLRNYESNGKTNKFRKKILTKFEATKFHE